MLQFPIHTETYRREKLTVSTEIWNVVKIHTDSNNWQMPIRMLNHHTLLYADTGNFICTVNNREFLLRAGEIVCCASGMRLGLYAADTKQNSFYLVTFDCNDLSFIPMPNGFCTTAMPNSTRESFVAMYRAIHPTERNTLSGDCHLLLTLLEIAKYAKNIPAEQALYEKVRQYILANVYADVSAPEVADALGYHKDYLCRIVRRCCGKTVKELIVEERMHAAKGLLCSTNYSIAKIASLLGFSNANSFIKYFTYHISMTPTEYRRKK